MTWLETAQQEIRRQNLGGWLIYDFRGSNPFAKRFVQLGAIMLSRRTFLFVPPEGQATLLLHSIERGSLPDLPYAVHAYSSRQTLEQTLSDILPKGEVALEFSPMNDIPYVSYVDAGTVDMLRSLGVTPVSSANILQAFSAWTPEQLEAHLRAVEYVMRAKDMAFNFIAAQTRMGKAVRETEVQGVMVDYFNEHDLIYDHPPIVGFGKHAGDPHYAPQAGGDSVLQPGDAILLDVWAKLPQEDAPYADITWMGVCGEASAELQKVWEVVRDARDLAVDTIQKIYNEGRYPQGREIDRVTRDFIASHGYGDAFTHRTGHSLGNRHTHGDAVHLDDFETCDTREMSPGIAVTVEPGVYLEHLGVRSEINLVLEATGARVTTRCQRDLIVIPSDGGLEKT